LGWTSIGYPTPIYAETMSTYLLLRNNKETGPFTIEEIKEMALKSYDLVWIVGKSAAWRYPGEIPEFKLFAPAVPEQPEDPFLKKTNTENPISEPTPNKKAEPANFKARESNTQRVSPSRSIYVNLPADKKQIGNAPARAIYDATLQTDPEPGYYDLYKKRPTRTIRISGKVIWISSIILLFGTGILTGFFISDRRKFFSSDANHLQKPATAQPAGLNNKKEISPVQTTINRGQSNNEEITNNDISVPRPVSGKSINGIGKKNLKNAAKKDSVYLPAASSAIMLTDSSLKQNNNSKTELLYQKIKAHPENYVSLVTGRYTTGLFGGISSIPITVSNNSPVMMDLVVVNIEYIQSNDKVFKTESISFNDLEPGETVTEKAPKSPRGTKITTRIHLINSRRLDLNYSN
jgi:hypothetical protein